MNTIYEPARNIPVADEVDVCVLGGSCTGVSAALRAARLGARVAVVEQQNCFGGGATSGMVCIWHSLYDTSFKKQIIGGTTQEIIERLKRRRHAIFERPRPEPPYRMNTTMTYWLNTEELKIELDEMVLEAGVIPYLHTFYAAPVIEDGKLTAAIIENKSGRQAIKAKIFIDATADGDLMIHLGAESYSNDNLQPATTGARVYGLNRIVDRFWDVNQLIKDHRDECGMRDIGWNAFIPGTPEVRFWAKSTVDKDCSDGGQLTEAEMEGRRQVRKMMDVIRKHADGGGDITLLALGSHIGIRETRQIVCRYKLTFDDIVNGREFDDAIAYCAYPPDIHHLDKPGATYYYLDGVKHYSCGVPTDEPEYSRWRDETPDDPTYWQIPYRSMTRADMPNAIVCGRAIDAEKGAFAAVRCMVSLNQTGEAAGVAAYEALDSSRGVCDIDIPATRKKMRDGGSIIP